MIRYALACGACEHAFEAWFASSGAFDSQKARGLVSCAACGSSDVAKQVMAPAVHGAASRDAPAGREALAARARAFLATRADYVGERFAKEARALHAGTDARENAGRVIWGQASAAERSALAEEGIAALPLPDDFVPPLAADKREVN